MMYVWVGDIPIMGSFEVNHESIMMFEIVFEIEHLA